MDGSGFTAVDGPQRNVTAVLSGAGDRAMVSYRDPAVEPPLGELVAAHRPRVLLLPILRHGAGVARALGRARAAGSLVFMDCQDVPVALGAVRDVLAQVDVFAPNAEEALRLTGAATVEDAARVLAEVVGTVVVKRGADGALALRGKEFCALPAPAVDVVDTTGAGDCFDAGFVHGLLGGADLRTCLALAVACGSASVTGVGSSAAPTRAQAAERVSGG
ncbi:carbohydrate kinase family protein [Actinokineospora spheciospongiae]|uniref:carbohydrate kinase family protein n=1 Tax=Actinokineospora spheciospongiae TaxID=909613 RepID=UPI000D8E0357|nr:PfkB family carbohydrate kinase [Actinokineospora spheciospongiae]PWW66606.1 sugar/nucleoside kinase (ribokinase family) [Actinokineospora spheciospongiae]